MQSSFMQHTVRRTVCAQLKMFDFSPDGETTICGLLALRCGVEQRWAKGLQNSPAPVYLARIA